MQEKEEKGLLSFATGGEGREGGKLDKPTWLGSSLLSALAGLGSCIEQARINPVTPGPGDP